MIDKLAIVCRHERSDVVMTALSCMLEALMRNTCAMTGRDYEQYVREFADTMLVDATKESDVS